SIQAKLGAGFGVQRIQPCPREQAQNQQCPELIEAAYELIGRPASQEQQSEPAPQIPEQAGAQVAQVVEIQGARGQLRLLRSRWMSLSCSVRRASSASASA